MNYKNILLAAIFLSIPFEATLVSLPLVFIFSAISYILVPEISVVLCSLAAGFVIDSLRLSPLGSTSFILALIFIIIELLKKEIIFSDYKIVILFLLISSYIFAKIFNYSDSLLTYVLIFGSGGLGVLYFNKKNSWLDSKSKFSND